MHMSLIHFFPPRTKELKEKLAGTRYRTHDGFYIDDNHFLFNLVFCGVFVYLMSSFIGLSISSAISNLLFTHWDE